MRTTHIRSGIMALAAAALAAACNKTSEPAFGTFTAQLTDSPIPNVESATVWVSQVYLIGGTDTTGSRYTISNTPMEYDLLTLQNGVTAALGSSSIPVGDYTQMRLVVDSAKLTLASPLVFTSGSPSATVKVPSGMQTGIKVNFAGAVHVAPGETILVVDFDASQNFSLTGTPTNPTGVLFKPVLHATVTNVAASIAGTVTPASAKAKLYAIFQSSDDTLATALADTITGAYKLWYLAPGTYTVTAVGTASGSTLNASKTVTLRAAQDTTGVNFP